MNTVSDNARVALITGASRGLGRAMTLALAARGWTVIGTYRNAKAEAQAVAEKAKEAGGKAVMLRYDALEGGAGELAPKVKEALKDLNSDRLNALVNNAGAAHHAPLIDTDLDAFDQMYRLHVRAPMALTQALVELLKQDSRVLFVSSGLARFALPGYGAYAAMKGAIEVVGRYAAKELGRRGIRVNVIAPGAIETDFGGGAVRDNTHVNQLVSDMTALGRPGLPEEIGDAVAAILSQDMRWMSGERIEISGGQGL
ncbi:MAG: SDR family oxidoreductase [Pseudomonadota bacterium]